MVLYWICASPFPSGLYLPPLLPPLLALIAGIVASPYFDNRYVWLVVPLALAVVVARPRFALGVVFLLGSGIRSHHDVRPPYIADDGLALRVVAVLDGPPEFRAPGYYFVARVLTVNGTPLQGRARLTYFPPSADGELARLFEELVLGSGDRVDVLVRLRPPAVYRNPEGFDYRRYLQRRGIYWTGSIRNPRLIRVLSRGWHGLDRIRRWASARIERRLGQDETVRALALGMVLGQRRRLPAEDERRFEAGGLVHLLVVSGFNLAIVAGAALWIGRHIRFGRRRNSTPLIASLLILTYAFLVEGEAPVTRATVMTMLLVLGMMMDRGYAIGNALSAAALCVLAVEPMAILESGFQLTFAAVLAILFLAGPLIRWWLGGRIAAMRHLDNPAVDPWLSIEAADWRVTKRIDAELAGRPLWFIVIPHRVWPALVETAIVSTTVQFCLLPWSVESYHRLSPVALPLNVLGAVVAAVVTPLGLLLIAVPDLIAPAIAGGIEAALNVLVVAVEGSLRWPGATFRVPSPPVLLWCAFGGVLVAAAWAIRRRRTTELVATAVAAVVIVGCVGAGDWTPAPPDDPVLTFLDVGQGDAILVELPDGSRYMVDGGGATSGGYRSLEGEGGFSIGEDVLTPYLLSRGIRRLDAVILTHAHHDHMDGLSSLVGNFRVGELWLGSNPMVPGYRDLLEQASLRAVPVRWLRSGQRAGPFSVLNPPGTRPAGTRVANDDSVVLLLETPGGSALLTGDLEADLPDAPSWVTVLKVPHHGSGNTRLRTRADLPVISVGANNPFGHPHPSRLPALRTDLLGAVRIVLAPERPRVSFPGLEIGRFAYAFR